VLMADATRVETRGRAMAVRETSNRIGLLTGPAVAGLIAATFGLRYIFLFIAACKVIVIIVTVLWIRERQRAARGQAPRRATGFRLPHPDLTMFRTRAFVALSICTFALSMVAGGTGVFRTLFPPQSAEVAGLDEAQIGLLIAIAGGFALVGGIPAGIASDRWGRRRLLLAGLLLTALSTFIMADMASFAGAAAAAIVFGLAEALGWGTMQAYAMDLAPEDRRGAFIGIWSLFQVLGQITGPLLIGTIADAYGFGDGFLTVTGLLLAGAAMVVVFGRATRVRAREPG
jgi:MFS family permease